MGACITDLAYFYLDSIPPSSSRVLHIVDAFFRNQSSPGNGNTVPVNLCLSSHAPDKKIDDNRDNDHYCTGFDLLFVDVDENNLIPITCFYNPTHDHIEIGNVDDAQLQLYSVSGQLLEGRTLLRGNNQLPMNKYSSGIYVVRVATRDGVSVVKIGKS